MADRDLTREYDTMVQRIDDAIKKTTEQHKARLRCAAGCSGCCTISSVLPLEAALLRQAISMLAAEVKMKLRDRGESSSCPLLVDELCAVYRNRPVICRTHGLPIAYVDYARQTIDVSACPLNFPAGYDFEQEELFFIDPFNEELVRLNEEFCMAGEMNPLARVSMRSLLNTSPEQKRCAGMKRVPRCIPRDSSRPR